MRATLTVPFLFFLSINIFAQHQAVFPDLSGEELLDKLVDEYKATPLPQATARDILFGEIYSLNDSLTCVYSGTTIYLDPSLDPTEAAFSSPAQINTEHTYPKSLGSEGLPEGDMHHIYATRADVNNDRGNLPFGEVPDAQAESWYYLASEITSIPSSNIDLYSERGVGLFEPPEAHKGNVARAMMYFYTMYQPQADAADPNFFELQKEDLCAWHLLDPIDGAEWNRTWQIADYQQGKPNPFVLDCTLPERTYCSEFGQNCTPVSTSEVEDSRSFSFDKVTPNPNQGAVVLHFSTKELSSIELEIFDLWGKEIDRVEMGMYAAGNHQFSYEKNEDIVAGTYLVCLTFNNGKSILPLTKKLMVVPR